MFLKTLNKSVRVALVVALLAVRGVSAEPLESEENTNFDFLSQPGVELVQVVREAYEAGFLNEFFERVDYCFKELFLKGAFKEELRRVAATNNAVPEEREAILRWGTELKCRIDALRAECNDKLIAACEGYPDLLVSQKVMSVVSYAGPSPEELNAWSKLPPYRGIDLRKKEASLDTLLGILQTQAVLKGIVAGHLMEAEHIDRTERAAYKLALKMEMFHRMKKLCELAGDQAMLANVERVEEASMTYEAVRMDRLYLKALGWGLLKPMNAVEERVAAIMSDYFLKRHPL